MFIHGECFNTWWELLSQSQIKSVNKVRVELSMGTNSSSRDFRVRILERSGYTDKYAVWRVRHRMSLKVKERQEKADTLPQVSTDRNCCRIVLVRKIIPHYRRKKCSPTHFFILQNTKKNWKLAHDQSMIHFARENTCSMFLFFQQYQAQNVVILFLTAIYFLIAENQLQ